MGCFVLSFGNLEFGGDGFFFNLLHLLVYCVSMHTHMAEHGCGGQRATCGSQVYPSMWALGVTLRSSGLVPARLPAELSYWHLFCLFLR